MLTFLEKKHPELQKLKLALSYTSESMMSSLLTKISSPLRYSKEMIKL